MSSAVCRTLGCVVDGGRRDELADGLGERHEIMQINIKKFAEGSPAQAVVQAILESVEEERIDPAQVVRTCIVLLYDLARVVDDRSMPEINARSSPPALWCTARSCS